MKKPLLIAFALAFAGLSPAAPAAEGEAFVRAEVGSSDVDYDIDDFASGSDDDNAWSVRGGYWFHRNVGVEGFYANLYDEPVLGVDVELAAYGLGVVAKKNFGAGDRGFFISGRAGVAHMESRFSNGSGHGKDESDKPYAGVGVGYDFGEVVGVSLNYDVHRADFDGFELDADALTAGVEVRF